MKSKRKKKGEKPLLEKLYDGMHNWFWIGVVYDWNFNPEKGKCWVYKDCTGIEMKAEDFKTIEMWLKWAGRTKQ